VCVCVCVCLGVNVSLSVCLRRVWVCFFVGSGCRCELSLEWPNITAMTKLGKSFSGGLGPKAARSATAHYGVWACVRDWIPEEMLKCGVGPGQLACFRFDERSREFHFYGSNDDVKLVSEELFQDGLIKEEHVMAMLPKAHHEPAPFLA
jgi:hypothetical protein